MIKVVLVTKPIELHVLNVEQKLMYLNLGNIVDPNGSTSFIQFQKGIKRSPKEGYLDSG